MIRTAFALAFLGALSVLAPVLGNMPASAETLAPASVQVSDVAAWQGDDVEPRMAAEAFILAMVNADARTVWTYASEEDQDAFATEAAVYDAFVETFPALVSVAEVRFEAIQREGDTTFVHISLTGRDGQTHDGAVGLWLDDAGSWKLVSCDVQPSRRHIAAL